MSTILIVTEPTDYAAAQGVATLYERIGYSVQIIASDDSPLAISAALRSARLIIPLVSQTTRQSRRFERLYAGLKRTTIPLVPIISPDVAANEHPNAIVFSTDLNTLRAALLRAAAQHFASASSTPSRRVRYPVLLSTVTLISALLLVTAGLALTTTRASEETPVLVLPTLYPTNTSESLAETAVETTSVASAAASQNDVERISLQLSDPAAFTVSVTDGPAPLSVTFTVDDPQDALVYEWDFDGDGTPDGDGAVTEHLYTTAGIYRAGLTVGDGDDTHHADQTILVRPSVNVADSATNSLLAEFTTSISEGPAPLTVTFQDFSLGPVRDYTWDFDGDGTPDSDEANPSFTYITPGNYEITLTVSDIDGNSDTVSAFVDVLAADEATTGVSVTAATNVAFEADLLVGLVPFTVNFTNNTTGDIANYRWDFDGDGIVESTEASDQSYTYETPGTYQATLTIRDTDGVIQSVSQPIKVFTSDNFGEIDADFAASPARGNAPLTVRFDNLSTGDIASYAWDFNGDGVTDSTNPNPGTFTFTEVGVYDASLVVTSAGGGEKAAALSIVVEPPGLSETTAVFADFSADKVSGAAPLNVQFTNQSTGTITAYAWDFDGDGVTDSTANTGGTFVYQTAGTYDATLTITSSEGDTTSVHVQIEVSEGDTEQLYANFIARPSSGPAPLTVQFTSFAFGDVVAYAWDFDGDGLIDNNTSIPPQYTYTEPGIYNSTFTVTSASGNQRTSTIVIQVFGDLQASFSTEPSTGDAPLTVTLTNESVGNIETYAWDFDGDGTIDSSAPVPEQLAYTEPGTYTITLTVTDNAGATQSANGTIVVNAPVSVPDVDAEMTVEASPPSDTTEDAYAENTPELVAPATEEAITAEATQELVAEVTEIVVNEPVVTDTPVSTTNQIVEVTAETVIASPASPSEPLDASEATAEVTAQPQDEADTAPPPDDTDEPAPSVTEVEADVVPESTAPVEAAQPAIDTADVSTDDPVVQPVVDEATTPPLVTTEPPAAQATDTPTAPPTAEVTEPTISTAKTEPPIEDTTDDTATVTLTVTDVTPLIPTEASSTPTDTATLPSAETEVPEASALPPPSSSEATEEVTGQ